MQIILKSSFQFPHWVMKNVWFSKVITIFKLIYLFWFKMEQTLSGFGVTRFTTASALACLSLPVSWELCYSAAVSRNSARLGKLQNALKTLKEG